MTITELAEKTASLSHVYQVTPEVYDSFQHCSQDMNPLHTDEAFAKAKGFRVAVSCTGTSSMPLSLTS